MSHDLRGVSANLQHQQQRTDLRKKATATSDLRKIQAEEEGQLLQLARQMTNAHRAMVRGTVIVPSLDDLTLQCAKFGGHMELIEWRNWRPSATK